MLLPDLQQNTVFRLISNSRSMKCLPDLVSFLRRCFPGKAAARRNLPRNRDHPSRQAMCSRILLHLHRLRCSFEGQNPGFFSLSHHKFPLFGVFFLLPVSFPLPVSLPFPQTHTGPVPPFAPLSPAEHGKS